MRKAEIVTRPGGEQQRGVAITHYVDIADQAGQFFIDMVKMCCHIGVMDGYDNNNQARIRISSPQEAVDRAEEITRLAIAKLDENDWVLHYPTYAELEKVEPQKRAGF